MLDKQSNMSPNSIIIIRRSTRRIKYDFVYLSISTYRRKPHRLQTICANFPVLSTSKRLSAIGDGSCLNSYTLYQYNKTKVKTSLVLSTRRIKYDKHLYVCLLLVMVLVSARTYYGVAATRSQCKRSNTLKTLLLQAVQYVRALAMANALSASSCLETVLHSPCYVNLCDVVGVQHITSDGNVVYYDSVDINVLPFSSSGKIYNICLDLPAY